MWITLLGSGHQKRNRCSTYRYRNFRQMKIWRNTREPPETCANLCWYWCKGKRILQEVFILYFCCLFRVLSCKAISEYNTKQSKILQGSALSNFRVGQNSQGFQGQTFLSTGGDSKHPPLPPPPHGPLTANAKVLTLLDCDLSLQNSILNSKTDLNKIISIKPASVSIFPVFVLCLTFGLSLNNQLKKSSGKSWIGQEFEV